jgi:hypothetical protein
MEEGPLSLEDAVHERSDWLRDREDDREEDQNLNNAYQCHVEPSEFLWPQKSVDQVNEKESRDNSGDGVFH